MTRTPSLALAVSLGLLGLGFASPGRAALPANFVDELVTAAVGPTAIDFTPDGRLLITRQTGELIVRQGTTNTSAVTFPTSQLCSNFERGLLGVAVDPNFGTGVGQNRFIYLFYSFHKMPAIACTSAGSSVNRVSRFVLADNNTVDLGTETILVDNMPSTAGNHNAGDVQFGKDGYLYITIGDGGSDYNGDSGSGGSNDAARDEYTLTGKVLRITKDGGIPPDNPFQGAGTARCNVTGTSTPGTKCQETFSWGHRNPFRIAFDPNVSGTRFFINDVGQNVREEIDLGTAGADFGWNCLEGTRVNNTGGPCNPTPPNMVPPIFEYTHGLQVPGSTSGTGCNSITGGAFVPNGIWPTAYDNVYLFSDYVCGWIFQIAGANTNGPFTTTADFATNLGGSSAVALRFGPAGTTQALYYTTFAGGGQVRRVRYAPAGNNAPTASFNANPLSGSAPLLVNFDGSASSDPDAGNTLTYLWNFGDGSPETTTVTATTSHSYAANGTYTASLRVRDNNFAFSTTVTQTIQVGGASAFNYFTVTPCRLIDTRNPNGPYGGPALAANATRSFVATGQCGVPTGAQAIAANLTVVGPTSGGSLGAGPTGIPISSISAINFSAGQVRTNNAAVTLSAGGGFDIFAGLPSGSTHLVLDVLGYYQ